MKWILLIIAGGLETFWAYELKCSEGFTKLLPSVLTILGMIASFYLLSIALKELPLGTAYAIWTGIGIIGTAVVGIVVFKEPATLIRVICIVFIMAGIIGLKLFPIN